MRMRIGRVAKQLGVSARTIRHYESLGLIDPPLHDVAGYRAYTEAEVVRIEQILSLAKPGMSLQSIKRFLDGLRQSSMTANQQLRALVSWQLELVGEQRQRLQELQQALQQLDFALQVNASEPLTLAHSISKVVGRNVEAKTSWRDDWGFDRWAASYDQAVHGVGAGYLPHINYDQVLDEVTRLVAGAGLVLDIGIGTGNLAQRITLINGSAVIGVDQSREMLLRAREKLPQAELLEGNFLALPLGERAVDAVVTTYALHHLNEDHKRLAVAEMVRVLKPGGKIVIGDNMFQSQAAREAEHQRLLQAGQAEAWADIEDEFLGDVGLLEGYLQEHGLVVSCHQWAPWTWVVWAEWPSPVDEIAQ